MLRDCHCDVIKLLNIGLFFFVSFFLESHFISYTVRRVWKGKKEGKSSLKKTSILKFQEFPKNSILITDANLTKWEKNYELIYEYAT